MKRRTTTAGIWPYIWYYRRDVFRIFLETVISWYVALIGHRRDCAEAYQQFVKHRRLGNPEHDLGKINELDDLFLAERLSDVKRVAIFSEAFWPKIDGVTRAAYLTLHYLRQTGREVIVFAPDAAPDWLCDSEIVSLPSACIGEVPKTRVVLSTPNTRRIIEKKLHEFQPDLIQLFSPALFSASGVRYANRYDVPVVANFQTDLPGYVPFYLLDKLTDDTSRVSRVFRRAFFMLMRDTFSLGMHRFLRTMHNQCQVTLVPTYSVLNDLQQYGYERLYIWRRGVDVEKFNPRYRQEKWRERLLNGRHPDHLICLYVGRIDREKHIDLLCEVASTPGVALTLVGEGAAQVELARRFAGTGVHFTGRLHGDDLSAAYASADVFVFPSPTETFGQVVQEAMASGLPAVVINQGGVADLVEDGKTGYLCPDDPHAFAAAVCKLRDNMELRGQMADNARHEAEKYPWEEIMKQLESYYATALQLMKDD